MFPVAACRPVPCAQRSGYHILSLTRSSLDTCANPICQSRPPTVDPGLDLRTCISTLLMLNGQKTVLRTLPWRMAKPAQRSVQTQAFSTNVQNQTHICIVFLECIDFVFVMLASGLTWIHIFLGSVIVSEMVGDGSGGKCTSLGKKGCFQ